MEEIQEIPVIEPANDCIPRDEKQKAYELWVAAQPPPPSKAMRRLARKPKPWKVKGAQLRFNAAKRFAERWKFFCIVWKLIGHIAAKRAEKAVAA